MKYKQNKFVIYVLDYFKSRHILNRYIQNFNLQNSNKINNIFDLKRYIEEKNYPQDLINVSFCWSATKEGHTFWNRHNLLLMKYLEPLYFKT